MEEPTSQLAQELVDHIITFLHDSPADWPACALVSRSWVHTAQSHIFRQICFVSAQSTNEDRWARFQQISHISPHLIHHVRQLHVADSAVSSETFLAICNFPFARLDGASVQLGTVTPSFTLAVQKLFSLPTLRRVQIWDECSRSLEHLELSCSLGEAEGFHFAQQSSLAIRLESLAIRTVDIDVLEWLTPTHCPLDFSGLRALSLCKYTDLLGSETFAPALQTIETLDLTSEYVKPTIDLSSFPNLTLLRIFLSFVSWPRITRIVFAGSFLGITSDELDLQLSGLPISPRLEFELSPAIYARTIPKFPLLSSRNMLHRANEDPEWFRTFRIAARGRIVR
ncbi:hypothetical protein C8R44DRAFT_751861 [Mycena epipterygia]|nr:hypothetical protein C8R44DRAFT_751861 [Mycena epipterygia]